MTHTKLKKYLECDDPDNIFYPQVITRLDVAWSFFYVDNGSYDILINRQRSYSKKSFKPKCLLKLVRLL